MKNVQTSLVPGLVSARTNWSQSGASDEPESTEQGKKLENLNTKISGNV